MGFPDELQAILSGAADEHGTPGAAVGIIRGDETDFTVHGVIHAEHPRPVGVGSLFQAGSITKTLTAAAVMVLVQDGRHRRLDVDRPRRCDRRIRWALEHGAGIVERDPELDPTLEIDVSRFTGRFLHAFAVLTVTAGEALGTVVATCPENELFTADGVGDGVEHRSGGWR